jgi:hypothetical protein
LAAASIGACGGDETGTGGTGATGTTQSTSTGTDPATTTGTTSGGGMGMGGMGGTGGGMGGSGMGGSGGMSGDYMSCSDCTDGNSGAPTKECKTAYDNCQKDTGCKDIYDCSYAACETTAMGGCCSVKCWKDGGAAEASWNLFKALDGCVYCTTCKDLCSGPAAAPTDATGYCGNINNNGANCP